MKTEDEKLQELLAKSLQQRASGASDFDKTWLAAEARYLAQRKRTRTWAAAVACAAALAVVLGLLPRDEQPVLPDFEVTAGLLETTRWIAPSDVLLPDHEIDIFSEMPQMPVSTEFNEGTLL